MVLLTITPEDRLAATLNLRSQTVSQYTMLQEQRDTALRMQLKTTDPKITQPAQNEVAQVDQGLAYATEKIEVLNSKAIEYTLECDKPFRSDLKTGFPTALRGEVPEEYFAD